MTKKILPMMIGAALAGGMTAAAADVQVMGHIDTSIDYFDNNSSGPGSDDTNLNCTTCSFGFKGSEDLGNGLKAIFKLDFQYDTTERNTGRASASSGGTNVVTSVVTTGGGLVSTVNTATVSAVTSVSDTSSITDRDQWLGLAGGFGKVRIGTISTGYKSHGAMLDPLYRTSLQGRDRGLQSSFHTGAGEEIQGRATNTIRFDSANYSGLQVVAHYTLDSDETDGENNNPYGIGASYENGGILAFADYITNDGDASTSRGDLSAWKLGGKYSMGDFAVMGQYEDSEEDVSGDETQVWHIGGSFTMGSNMLYAAYGNTEVDPGTGSSTSAEDTDAWTIAGVHSLSKNTNVYLGYNNQDDDKAGGIDRDQFSVGMKHKF